MKETISAHGPIALVLQGGGARGAYQAGVIKAVAELSTQGQCPFRILSGTSVGSLNAAALAAGATDFQNAAHRLEALWGGLSSSSIYHTGRWKLLSSSIRQLTRLLLARHGLHKGLVILDNAPFEALLRREFSGVEVEQAIRAGVLDALCITASSYNGGRAVTFYEGRENIAEWHLTRRAGVRTTIGPEHLLASSALPFLFPAVCIDGRFYGDGALRLRTPLSPSIRAGASAILAIGVSDTNGSDQSLTANGHVLSQDNPSPAAVSGHLLDVLFNEGLDADIERLQHINQTLKLLSPQAREALPLREIDILEIQPSQDVRQLAEHYRDELPPGAKLLLRGFGAGHGHGQLLSYFLFETGFINALMKLGYNDTMAKRASLKQFFCKHGVTSL